MAPAKTFYSRFHTKCPVWITACPNSCHISVGFHKSRLRVFVVFLQQFHCQGAASAAVIQLGPGLSARKSNLIHDSAGPGKG